MATIAELREMLSRLFSGAVGAPTAATPPFFQTRITRTPGVVDPTLPANKGAEYTPAIPREQQAAISGLPPELSSILQKAFGGEQGFIRYNPENTNPNLMRHEQFHSIYDRGGLANIQGDIISQLDPGLIRYLKDSPIYQEQAKTTGWPSTISEEGAAFNLGGNTGPPSQNLKEMVAKQLSKVGKKRELGEFQKLVK